MELSGTSDDNVVLPGEAKLAVLRVFNKYTVLRASGGMTMLCRLVGGRWRIQRPESVPEEFSGWLDGEYRQAVLRELRQHSQAREAEEVWLNRIPTSGYVVDNVGDSPGWYWRPGGGQGQTFICERTIGMRLTLLRYAGKAGNLAANNPRKGVWQQLVGFIGGEGVIYPRARSNNEFELLVACPPGASRNIDVVVKTTTGPGVFRLGFVRHMDGRVEVHTPDVLNPLYFVVSGKKQRVRVFKTP